MKHNEKKCTNKKCYAFVSMMYKEDCLECSRNKQNKKGNNLKDMFQTPVQKWGIF